LGSLGSTTNLTVTAKGPTNTVTLPVAVTIATDLPAKLTMTPQLPDLRGNSKSTFEYQLNVKNESGKKVLVGLSAQAPANFDATYTEQYGSQELNALPLDPGQSKDVKLKVRPPNTVAAGQYKVTARATAEDANVTTDLGLDITGQPKIDISGREGILSTRAEAGKEASVAIVITNTGGAKVSNAVLTDQYNGLVGFGNPPLLDAVSSRGSCSQNNTQVTCNGGAIEGGGVWTVTIRGVVSAAGGTTINNNATVTGTKSAQTFTNSASATTQVTGTLPGGNSPDLTIGKNGPLSAAAGGPITYTMTINNVGNATATGVKVTDTLPQDISNITVGATSLFTCSANEPVLPHAAFAVTVTCIGGQVNAGASATITVHGTVSGPGPLVNTAVVDPDNTIDEGVIGDTQDFAERNNTSNTVTTNVSPIPPPPPPPITIDKVKVGGLVGIAVPGELVEYRITVTNGTLGRADYLTMTDTTQGLQAASLKVLSATSESGTTPICAVSAPIVTCTMTRLAVGDDMVIRIQGMVVASAGSTIINNATVNANIKNTGYTATDQVQTTIKPAFDLTITKSDTPDPVCASSFPEGGGGVCQGGLRYDFVIGNGTMSGDGQIVAPEGQQGEKEQ
jgi:uncharacterized repeat protein (TIGR01451 family)